MFIHDLLGSYVSWASYLNQCIYWRFWCCFISMLMWALIMLSAVYSRDSCKKTHSIVIGRSGFSPSGLASLTWASHVHMKVKSLSDLTALMVTCLKYKSCAMMMFLQYSPTLTCTFPTSTVRNGFINASSACTGFLYIAHTLNTMAIQSALLAKYEEKEK